MYGPGFDGPGYGFGMGMLSHLVGVLGGLVIFAAVVFVLVLLARYLLVATRAAKLYIERNTTTPTAETKATETKPKP